MEREPEPKDWRFRVHEWVYNRRDGDYYKIMQRRVEYGEKYYKLDSGRIVPERDLTVFIKGE
jgi:hypothetical protein